MSSTYVDIGAVIEVEAAREILVGLAFPAMLGGNQFRHDLEHFADPRSRLLFNLFAGDSSLRSGVRREKCPIRRCGYADLRKRDQVPRHPGLLQLVQVRGTKGENTLRCV